MKNLIASLAFASLAFTTLNQAAHADTISDGLALTINGAAVAGVYNPVLEEVVFTDVLTNTSLFHGSLLSTTVSTITASYTDVSGVLGNLAVADACVSTTVIGSSNSPCSNVAIVGTITGIGPLNAEIGTLTLIGADISLGFNHFAPLATVDIGSANGNIGFDAPAPPPAAATPEPASLTLMATGLVAAAGAVRRKLMA